MTRAATSSEGEESIRRNVPRGNTLYKYIWIPGNYANLDVLPILPLRSGTRKQSWQWFNAMGLGMRLTGYGAHQSLLNFLRIRSGMRSREGLSSAKRERLFSGFYFEGRTCNYLSWVISYRASYVPLLYLWGRNDIWVDASVVLGLVPEQSWHRITGILAGTRSLRGPEGQTVSQVKSVRRQTFIVSSTLMTF